MCKTHNTCGRSVVLLFSRVRQLNFNSGISRKCAINRVVVVVVVVVVFFIIYLIIVLFLFTFQAYLRSCCRVCMPRCMPAFYAPARCPPSCVPAACMHVNGLCLLFSLFFLLLLLLFSGAKRTYRMHVTAMSQLFSGANEFKGDISKWDVSSAKNMHDMFHGIVRQRPVIVGRVQLEGHS